MNVRSSMRQRATLALPTVLIALALSQIVSGQAPTFDCKSTGADGALDLTGTPAGTTVELDPVARGIDPEKDNVFHFTSVTIPTGVTIKLALPKLQPVPVYWLVRGDIVIDGTVDLNGENGTSGGLPPAVKFRALPGPGGFPGGAPAIVEGGISFGVGDTFQRGGGPAGGLFDVGGGTRHGGTFISRYLYPILGGSGGAGVAPSGAPTGEYGGGGGGGGGAIVIACAGAMTLNGVITARGGRGGVGGAFGTAGHGAGGSVRVLTPELKGSGKIDVSYHAGVGIGEGGGFIRVESFQNRFRGTLDTTGSRLQLAAVVPLSPTARFLPPNDNKAPSLTLKIDGVPVPVSPTGSFEVPDVAFAKLTVDLLVEGKHIPPGTSFYMNFRDERNVYERQSFGPLTGTLEATSYSLSGYAFPKGFSQYFLRCLFYR